MTLCMYMLDYIESFMWYRSGPSDRGFCVI